MTDTACCSRCTSTESQNEQLRQAHGRLADEAARLEAKVKDREKKLVALEAKYKIAQEGRRCAEDRLERAISRVKAVATAIENEGPEFDRKPKPRKPPRSTMTTTWRDGQGEVWTLEAFWGKCRASCPRWTRPGEWFSQDHLSRLAASDDSDALRYAAMLTHLQFAFPGGAS